MFNKDYRKVLWQDIELINKFAENLKDKNND